MPTGYTAGILDGTIKSFKDFAKLCTRAFGATMHLRDEPLSTSYTKRIPSPYYKDKLKEAQEELLDVKIMTPSDLVFEKKTDLKQSISYHQKRIDEIKETRAKLDTFLSEAQSYTPPTPEHINIKSFMINQLEETIKYDGGYDYHEEEINRINIQLANLDAESIRAAKIISLVKDLKYYQESYNKEIESCNQSNKWIEDFEKSLN